VCVHATDSRANFASCLRHSVNPRDVKGSSTKSEDFHFDVEFDGIDIALAEEERDVVQAAVKGRVVVLFTHPPLAIHLCSSPFGIDVAGFIFLLSQDLQ